MRTCIVRPQFLALASSAAHGVPQDDAVAEIDQFQVQAHTVREEPLAAADDYRADEHLNLVDEPARLLPPRRSVSGVIRRSAHPLG